MLTRRKNPVSLKVSIQIHLLRVRAAINEYVLAIERLNQVAVSKTAYWTKESHQKILNRI